MELVKVQFLQQPLDARCPGSGDKPIGIDPLIGTLLKERDSVPSLPRECWVPHSCDKEYQAVQHFRIDRLPCNIRPVSVDKHVERRPGTELVDRPFGDDRTRLNLVSVLDHETDVTNNRVLLRSDNDSP